MYIVICQKNLCIENIHNTVSEILELNTYDNLELISVHIPKCGGTTFWNILAHIYGERLTHITDISKLNDGSIDKDILGVHGHYRFNPEWLNIYPNAKVCTWIRHPIDRLISHYVYIATFKGIPAGDKMFLDFRGNAWNIFEFAERVNNIFSYIEDISLNDIDFIGDVSSYSSDLLKLASIMNWTHPITKNYRIFNQGKYSQKIYGKKLKIKMSDRKELARILRRDIERYEYIKNYKDFTSNYWRYAKCKEKREWDKIVREKSYLPS